MALLDIIQDTVHKVLPEKKQSIPLQPTGIGNSGHAPFEDDMIVSKPAVIFYASQIFFNFLAFCCFASCASFQAKWGVGPSGLSGISIFIALAGIFYSFFLLLTPVVYEKYDKGARLARALRELRVGFILATTGLVVSLLIAFITIISAFTEPGCKDASKDPHASKGDAFKQALGGFCSTKKAGAIFFLFAFIFWACSFGLMLMDWRSGRIAPPRDPPFTHPVGATDDFAPHEDEESLYDQARKSGYDDSDAGHEARSPFSDENRYPGVPSATAAAPSQPRPSIDAYGAFSDPAPSGFGAPASQPPSFARPLSPPDEGPRVSRTMQYADPYAAIRATVAAGQTKSTSPPSYDGYR